MLLLQIHPIIYIHTSFFGEESWAMEDDMASLLDLSCLIIPIWLWSLANR